MFIYKIIDCLYDEYEQTTLPTYLTNRYLRGPKTVPCGTPKSRRIPSEVLFPIATCCNMSLRYDFKKAADI